MEVINVTIDRSRWDVAPNKCVKHNGNEKADSYLYDSTTGLQCCLGFLGVACGFSLEELDNVQEPFNVVERTGPGPYDVKRDSRWPKGLLTFAPEGCAETKLIQTNDSCDLTNAEREAKIHEYGLAAGINFTFEGEYLTPPGGLKN